MMILRNFIFLNSLTVTNQQDNDTRNSNLSFMTISREKKRNLELEDEDTSNDAVGMISEEKEDDYAVADSAVSEDDEDLHDHEVKDFFGNKDDSHSVDSESDDTGNEKLSKYFLSEESEQDGNDTELKEDHIEHDHDTELKENDIVYNDDDTMSKDGEIKHDDDTVSKDGEIKHNIEDVELQQKHKSTRDDDVEEDKGDDYNSHDIIEGEKSDGVVEEDKGDDDVDKKIMKVKVTYRHDENDGTLSKQSEDDHDNVEGHDKDEHIVGDNDDYSLPMGPSEDDKANLEKEESQFLQHEDLDLKKLKELEKVTDFEHRFEEQGEHLSDLLGERLWGLERHVQDEELNDFHHVSDDHAREDQLKILEAEEDLHSALEAQADLEESIESEGDDKKGLHFLAQHRAQDNKKEALHKMKLADHLEEENIEIEGRLRKKNLSKKEKKKLTKKLMRNEKQQEKLEEEALLEKEFARESRFEHNQFDDIEEAMKQEESAHDEEMDLMESMNRTYDHEKKNVKRGRSGEAVRQQEFEEDLLKSANQAHEEYQKFKQQIVEQLEEAQLKSANYLDHLQKIKKQFQSDPEVREEIEAHERQELEHLRLVQSLQAHHNKNKKKRVSSKEMEQEQAIFKLLISRERENFIKNGLLLPQKDL